MLVKIVTAHHGPAPIRPLAAGGFRNPIVAMVPTGPIPGLSTNVPPHLTLFYVNNVTAEEANIALTGVPIYSHSGAATPEIEQNVGNPVTWLRLDDWYSTMSSALMDMLRSRYSYNVSQDVGKGGGAWVPHLTVGYGARQDLVQQLADIGEITMTGPYVFDLNGQQMPRQAEQRQASTGVDAWLDIMLGTSC